MRPLRIAVIGHVEHVTIGRVPAVPAPGDIAHLEQNIGAADLHLTGEECTALASLG